MKKIFLFAALLSFSNFLFAQDEPTHHGAKGLIGYFRTGYNMPDFSSINNSLSGTKIVEVPNTLSLNTGGGIFHISHNFMQGIEGYGFLKTKAANANYETTFDGAQGNAMFGWVVFKTTKVTVIPVVSFGGYHVSSVVRNILPDSTNFNQVLFNPNNSTHLQTMGFSVSPKIICEIKTFKLIHVGVEAGYDYSVMNKGWTANGQKIKDGPTTNLNGLFFGLTIGAGFIGD